MLLPPAPWYVDPDYRPGMEWNNHILSADSNTVCFMAHDPDDNAKLENAAHLISAAPDLLEALKGLLGDWGDDDTMDHMPGVKQARAAIAKAAGSK